MDLLGSGSPVFYKSLKSNFYSGTGPFLTFKGAPGETKCLELACHDGKNNVCYMEAR